MCRFGMGGPRRSPETRTLPAPAVCVPAAKTPARHANAHAAEASASRPAAEDVRHRKRRSGCPKEDAEQPWPVRDRRIVVVNLHLSTPARITVGGLVGEPGLGHPVPGPREPRADDEVSELVALEPSQRGNARGDGGIAVEVRRREEDPAVVQQDQACSSRSATRNMRTSAIRSPVLGWIAPAYGRGGSETSSRGRGTRGGRRRRPPWSPVASPGRACPDRPSSPWGLLCQLLLIDRRARTRPSASSRGDG